MSASDHHPMKSNREDRYGADTRIHPEGLYRWGEFSELIPFSRETWRKRVLSGKAPASIRLGGACTVWKGAAILEWLKDPNKYINGKENPSFD